VATVNVRYLVDDVAAAVAFYTTQRGCDSATTSWLDPAAHRSCSKIHPATSSSSLSPAA